MGTDEAGNPCHSSMYRYLWSNGPKEALEFSNYSFEEHFGRPIPSYPPRPMLFDYITGRAKKARIRDNIRFNTLRDVRYCKETGQFAVTSRNASSDTETTETFDHVIVIVATGHFSTPNYPYVYVLRGVRVVQWSHSARARLPRCERVRQSRRATGGFLLFGGGYRVAVLEIRVQISNNYVPHLTNGI